MSEFPKMVYRGGPYADQNALNEALTFERCAIEVVKDEAEEAALAELGFGPLNAMLAGAADEPEKRGPGRPRKQA